LPLQAAPGEAAGAEQGSELRIAWQYRKYIKDMPSAPAAPAAGAGGGGGVSSFRRAGSSSAVEAGLSRQWCRSYDLTRPLGEEALRQSGLVGGGARGVRSGAAGRSCRRCPLPPAPTAAASVAGWC
jgi:elongator complex protein 4